MYLDLVGLVLTILIVSPRYWYLVVVISFFDIILSVFLSIALWTQVTEVIAGGIFTTINDGGSITYLLGPILLLIAGIGMIINMEKIHWWDLINPFSSYRRPLPVMMIKTSLFRIAVFAWWYGAN